MSWTLAESDLVKDSKLETTFSHGYTLHVFYVSGETQRMIRKEEQWKKEEHLGEGGFGTVWKEKLVTDTGEQRYRAVKRIQKRADYVRELEAIAKFSHPKVFRLQNCLSLCDSNLTENVVRAVFREIIWMV